MAALAIHAAPYATDKAALVTKLSATAPDLLAGLLAGVVAVCALSLVFVLAAVVWSVWPKNVLRGWEPKPREAPPARTETQGNGDAPNAKDVVLKQPSTP